MGAISYPCNNIYINLFENVNERHEETVFGMFFDTDADT